MDSPLEQFKVYIASLSPIAEMEWHKVIPLCSVKRYREGEVIQYLGEVSGSVMFLCDGLARSYLIDAEGRDFTWSIHYNSSGSTIKNLFIVDYASFIGSEPSKLTFEALKETTVLIITSEDIQRLYSSSQYWANIGRQLSEWAYYFTHHRTLSLLCQSAKERYQSLLSENPSFLKIVPQHYIASYLGITPQSLSRIKRELAVTKCE